MTNVLNAHKINHFIPHFTHPTRQICIQNAISSRTLARGDGIIHLCRTFIVTVDEWVLITQTFLWCFFFLFLFHIIFANTKFCFHLKFLFFLYFLWSYTIKYFCSSGSSLILTSHINEIYWIKILFSPLAEILENLPHYLRENSL